MEAEFALKTLAGQPEELQNNSMGGKSLLYGRILSLFHLFYPLGDKIEHDPYQIAEIDGTSISPCMQEMSTLSWVVEAYQKISETELIPNPESGHFCALYLLLQSIEKSAEQMEIPLRDFKSQQETFFHSENSALPLKKECRYPAEIFCFAKRIKFSSQVDYTEDLWTLFITPSHQLKIAAENLIDALNSMLQSIRRRDENGFKTAFPTFDDSWNIFIDLLNWEKRIPSSIWTGFSLLNFIAENILSSQRRWQALSEKNEQIRSTAEKLSLLGKNVRRIDKELVTHLRYHLNQTQFLTSSQMIFKKSLRTLAQETGDQVDLIQEFEKNPFLFEDLVPKLACLHVPLRQRVPTPIPEIFSDSIRELYKVQAIVSEILIENPIFRLKDLRLALIHCHLPSITCQNKELIAAIKKKKLIEELNNFSKNLRENNAQDTNALLRWCLENIFAITLKVDIPLWLTAEKIIELEELHPSRK